MKGEKENFKAKRKWENRSNRIFKPIRGYTQKLWVYQNREANKKGKEMFKLFLDTLLAENEKKEKKGHGTENVAFLLKENFFLLDVNFFDSRFHLGKLRTDGG